MSSDKEFSEKDEIEIVQNELTAVHNYSAGLGYALSDTLNNYNAVLAVQREAIDSAYATFRSPIMLGAIESMQSAAETYREVLTPLSTVIADIGIATVGLNKLHTAGVLGLEYLGATTVFSTLALDSVREQQTILQNTFAAYDGVDVTHLFSAVSPSVQTVGQGLTQMIQSLGGVAAVDFETIPELEVVRESAEVEDVELEEYQERLDALLTEINPILVEYRRGAWTAFNAKSEDYIGQASSSMRRVVDTLLREIAPEKEVAETEYFKNSPDAKDKNERPTRKAKVMYIVNWDEGKAEHLKRFTTGFLAAYDNLSAWDHVPLNKDGFVQGALVVIEGHLLSLLTVNEA
ncbi:hypothetical protein A3I99_00970 [Candidatus Kaiserbacteria bacterium RIFCSPLOWO2_02_FULL_45_11b]|uniref:Predicted pPIWI-associating nuclease domain-containing protein n=1 Tax=Candidatus Kaiserbacteria bacterium RIFCSPLOWO2_12_FULL_45_26 TaxID=1798525 RepID=A0A1F6FFJ3_9BACT|nr:MAG: hypothetical protein A2Z56_04925 [Candidatus Kaiserbacteria bacterium RIFCSPHIGHO2_12_45_16]OGG69509.1 MAG: hypothetical protein A2929_02985 [Candidatus Kaiserbacteria bacterium RIFCSPLOWO2_01_FULL_45_25]OGG80894.1 MAG: hypothetical protein A3I99_00970 [Candidatus Kaiserbacteria bacterium RIFCSPLOWO2_02_FULL_45_11b]OGG84631.1 MAG: hypothetical protein A3G90_00915 [Candidatus Kaiserbacteria bacterium RIFCSPLOWO2_12_FULL_45_26]